MGSRYTFSRRHMLAISAAAGSLTIAGDYRGAAAQAGKRIERLDYSRPIANAPLPTRARRLVGPS